MRRLEGKELHPRRDANGTHRFDADEVAALAERLMESGSLEMVHAESDCGEPWNRTTQREEQLLVDIGQLRTQLVESHQRLRNATRALERFKLRTARALSKLGRELMQSEPDLSHIVLAAMRELDE